MNACDFDGTFDRKHDQVNLRKWMYDFIVRKFNNTFKTPNRLIFLTSLSWSCDNKKNMESMASKYDVTIKRYVKWRQHLCIFNEKYYRKGVLAYFTKDSILYVIKKRIHDKNV